MAKRSKTSVQTVEGASTRREAVRLRKRGLTFAEIGDRLGVSRQAAHAHVTKELRELNEECREETEEMRRLMSEQIDAMLVGLQPGLDTGDEKAVSAASRLLDRKAKLWALDMRSQDADALGEAMKQAGEIVAQVLGAEAAAKIAAAVRSAPNP